MNSEFSTPNRSQQHSPAPLSSHQLSTVCADVQLATPPVNTFGLTNAHVEVSTPGAQAIDVGGATPQFAYLKGAYPTRSFSPTSMDFANMSIAAGYPTPQSMTPAAAQQQQTVQTDGTAASSTGSPISIDASAAAASSAVVAAASASVSATASAAAGPLSADKPDYSYASLIAQSLKDAQMQRRTLNGIYEWIQEHFPYYRTRQNWQNSIRHNLSLNKGFMKVKRDETHPGKGSFWTFTPGYETCLNSGHFKPIRSRSGRAALAAAAAMAAVNAVSKSGSSSMSTDAANDASSDNGAAGADVAQPTAPVGRRSDKKGSRSAKSVKSLKRSHSMPPKEHGHLLTRGPLSATTPGASSTLPSGAATGVVDPSSPSQSSRADALPLGNGGRSPAKKMRVSSTQSHLSASAVHPSPLHIATTMPQQQRQQQPTPFSLSPAFMASPALTSATPLSAMSTSHTPLHHTAPFQFPLQPSCSMSMPGMDVASIPAVPTARIGVDGGAASGPYMGSFAPSFGEAAASIDNAGLFAEHGGEMLYGGRRAHMQSRLSWHGPESMTQALANMQQQHHGHAPVLMGADADIGLPMLGDPSAMAICTDNSVTGSPVDWAMLAGISAPQPAAADHAAHVPQLQHMADPQHIQIQQQRIGSSGMIPGEPAIPGAHNEGNGSQGFMAFYDEMLRDPSSLMSVLGQDLTGWQCPSKTSTIDPAALCAVDPESNTL